MELFLQLLVVLVLARVFGEAMIRLRQPALVGEILAGVVLAVVATELSLGSASIATLPASELIENIADIGVFFLVLLAGIEMQPREISRQSGASFAVAVGGMLVPCRTRPSSSPWHYSSA
jgi:Kef-type K+ transport system membrane component KefB